MAEQLEENYVQITSAHRISSETQHGVGIAADLYFHNSTSARAIGYRNRINGLDIFNRVASYYNLNIVRVDYKAGYTQAAYHDYGKGWARQK